MSNETRDLKPGQSVCIVGYGTANLVHRHRVITRTTYQFITVEKITGSPEDKLASRERFRRDNGHSVPRSDPYGGRTIHATCQRPRKEQ